MSGNIVFFFDDEEYVRSEGKTVLMAHWKMAASITAGLNLYIDGL